MSTKDLRMLMFKSKFATPSSDDRDSDNSDYLKKAQRIAKSNVSNIVKGKLNLK